MWVSAAVQKGANMFAFASAVLTAVCLHQRGNTLTQLLATSHFTVLIPEVCALFKAE